MALFIDVYEKINPFTRGSKVTDCDFYYITRGENKEELSGDYGPYDPFDQLYTFPEAPYLPHNVRVLSPGLNRSWTLKGVRNGDSVELWL